MYDKRNSQRKDTQKLLQHGFESYDNEIHLDFDQVPSAAAFAISPSSDYNLEHVEHNPSSSPINQTELVILAENLSFAHSIKNEIVKQHSVTHAISSKILYLALLRQEIRINLQL